MVPVEGGRVANVAVRLDRILRECAEGDWRNTPCPLRSRQCNWWELQLLSQVEAQQSPATAFQQQLAATRHRQQPPLSFTCANGRQCSTPHLSQRSLFCSNAACNYRHPNYIRRCSLTCRRHHFQAASGAQGHTQNSSVPYKHCRELQHPNQCYISESSATSRNMRPGRWGQQTGSHLWVSVVLHPAKHVCPVGSLTAEVVWPLWDEGKGAPGQAWSSCQSDRLSAIQTMTHVRVLVLPAKLLLLQPW